MEFTRRAALKIAGGLTSLGGSQTSESHSGVVHPPENQTTEEVKRGSEDIDYVPVYNKEGELQHYVTSEPAFKSVTVDELPHVVDYVVESEPELVDALSNATAGDHIRVASIIEITDWVDINVPLTISGRTPNSDGLRVVDGVNVGGIRIGNDCHTTDVEIKNLLLDGNTPNKVETLQSFRPGIQVLDAERVWIHNNRVIDWPETTSNTADDVDAAGIIALSESRGIYIKDNYIDNSGYRGIETSGKYITIQNNHIRNVQERHISLDAGRQDNSAAQYVTVSGNVCEGGGSTGSCIAGEGRNSSNFTITGKPLEGIVIANNVCNATGKRTGIALREFDSPTVSLAVCGNTVKDGKTHNIEIVGNSSIGASVTIVGNAVDGATLNGIRGAADTLTISGNRVANSGHYGILSSGGCVSGNVVSNTGSPGIRAFGDTLVASNFVKNPNGTGILTTSDGVSITSNFIRDAEKHGILVKNSGVLVANNRIENVTGGGEIGVDEKDGPNLIHGNYATGVKATVNDASAGSTIGQNL